MSTRGERQLVAVHTIGVRRVATYAGSLTRVPQDGWRLPSIDQSEVAAFMTAHLRDLLAGLVP